MDWEVANAPAALERIRKTMGMTKRPNNLFVYTGVMPTLDLTSLGIGSLQQLSSLVTLSGIGNFMWGLSAANFAGLTDGLFYRLRNLSVSVVTLGTGCTIQAAIYSLEGSGAATFYSKVGEGNPANTVGFVGQTVGGELANPLPFVAGPVAGASSQNMTVGAIVTVAQGATSQIRINISVEPQGQ